jgi:hypothetical protein
MLRGGSHRGVSFKADYRGRSVRISLQSRFDAVRIDVDYQASQARPPANQRCAAITEYLDIQIAAALSGSADLAPPKVDHAARTPLFLAIQVAM